MIYLLSPVYNEKDNLLPLYHRIRQGMSEAGLNDYRFIFVNDGSTDGSLELLKDLENGDSSIIIISHFPNKGVKVTFLEGFLEFLSRGSSGDILVTFEADNTFDEQLIGKMIEPIKSGSSDITLASCYSKGGGVEATNIIRIFLSSVANLLIRLRFCLWEYHTLSSFDRAFSFECLKQAFSKEQLMTSDGYTCVVEMLIKLHRMDFKIVEIPMLLRSSRRKGKSKMPVLKTIFRYFILCIRI